MKDKVFKVSIVLIILLAIILRLKAYLSCYTLWLDECSLALSIMHRNIFGFFKPLEHVQSAPPLFMMATKALTNIFKINEFSLRFIPFLASIFSVPLFYYFSKKILIRKVSILVATFLFAVNYRLIYYGVEFKQYSLDVLMVLLAFLAFLSFDIDKMKIRKALLFGCLAFLGFLFSLPVVFVISAFIIYNFCNFKNINKEKVIKLLVFLSPFIILFPIYYLFVLYPSQYEMMKVYGSLWQDGFIVLNFASIIKIIRLNIVYFFEQQNFALFGALLLLFGLIASIKRAKFSKDFLLLYLFLLCVVLASYFHIYPMKERVALYLLPFLLVLIIKPLDYVSLKNKFSSVLIVIFFLFFISSYCSISYYRNIYPNILNRKGDGAKFMHILKENYNYENKEIVVYNDASDSIYEYNAMREDFYTDRFIKISLSEYGKEFYTGLLDMLPKGYTYWFYYPYDYYKHAVIPFVREWAQTKDIKEEYLNGNSYFLKVSI